MQQLENKSESFDFNQELEADLAVVNDAQEMMSRWFDINEKIDEMQGSKDVVDNVLSKVEDLATLESQLREPSEFRNILDNNKSKLDGYSKEMWRLLDTYNNWVEAWQKFEKDVVNWKVEKFKWYEEEAKWIETTLTEMEKEIDNLKKLDDLQRENEKLQRQNQELQRRNEELQRTQRQELIREDSTPDNPNQETPNQENPSTNESSPTTPESYDHGDNVWWAVGVGTWDETVDVTTPSRFEEPINQPNQPDLHGKRQYENLSDEETNRVRERLQNYSNQSNRDIRTEKEWTMSN